MTVQPYVGSQKLLLISNVVVILKVFWF